MAVAAGIEFERNRSRSNDGLFKKRERLPFHALLNEAELSKVLNVAFDVNAILGVAI